MSMASGMPSVDADEVAAVQKAVMVAAGRPSGRFDVDCAHRVVAKVRSRDAFFAAVLLRSPGEALRALITMVVQGAGDLRGLELLTAVRWRPDDYPVTTGTYQHDGDKTVWYWAFGRLRLEGATVRVRIGSIMSVIRPTGGYFLFARPLEERGMSVEVWEETDGRVTQLI